MTTEHPTAITTKDPCRIGNEVIVLTPSYHWTGRIVDVTPFGLVLEHAMMFLEIGQTLGAVVGKWDGAHGDPIPDGQYVKVPAPPSSQVIDYRGKLPREQLRG